jgi:hypothetical protein
LPDEDYESRISSLEVKIAGLEGSTGAIEFQRKRNLGDWGTIGGGPGLQFVRADKNENYLYDPLTATAWENSTKSGNGTIDWAAVFPPIPKSARGVLAYVEEMSAGAGGAQVQFFASSAATNPSLSLWSLGGGNYTQHQVIIPVNDQGTSYYNFTVGVTLFYLRVVGWFC